MKTSSITSTKTIAVVALGLLALSQSVHGAIIANPTVTGSATPFNGSYVAGNLFDGTSSEYATSGGGAGAAFSTTGGTWLEMDFGSAVTMDRFTLMSRGNTVDAVGASRLILSNDATFDGTDTIFTFDPTGTNGHGFLHSFTATTARYARWEVGTSIGGSQNLGGVEMRFLNTPTGSSIASASVIGGATAFNGQYALANAVGGDAGSGIEAGVEYASLSQGTNMFVDFDLGATVPISGFDFFDRIGGVDRTTAFDLIFSDDPTFTTTVATQSYTASGWGYDQTFAAVNARYVRLDATATAGVGNNSGISEMIFYTVPEPSSALLGLLGLAFIVRRRR